MDAIKTIDQGCKSEAPEPAKKSFRPGLRSAVARIEALFDKRRSRLALLDLTDEQLRDIGVSREEARREGLRSFWE